MLMNEFDHRFTDKDEKSFLFEILRRIGCLEHRAMLATAQDQGWVVWDPTTDPSGGSGVGLARA
ncbi:MAG: hypothetical protein DMF53_12970 [Acidobacteria bacterium]|nr:MAG: hypothetical protein DMF53_12970 [Acidobacteriota bacterium]